MGILGHLALFSFSILLIGTFPCFGKDQYSINRDHSSINFQLGYMGLGTVNGRFNQFSCSFNFDKNALSISDIKLRIDPGSIDTGNSKRDRHLLNKDFFSVDQYPLIEFIPNKKIYHFKQNKVLITGDLIIKNKSKLIEINVKYIGGGSDTWNKLNEFFSFSFNVDRSHFGLNWNKTLSGSKFLVDKVVKVTGVIQAQPSHDKTSFSRFLIPDTKQTRLREKYFRGEIDKKKIESPMIQGPRENENSNLTSVVKEIRLSKPEKNNKLKTRSIPLWLIIILGFYGFMGAAAISMGLYYFASMGDNNIKTLKKILIDIGVVLLITPFAIALWKLFEY